MDENFYKHLFESLPDLYLVLKPDLTMIAATDAYLAATMTKRDQIIGKACFDVFPENPEENDTTGESTLRASFNLVLSEAKLDAISIQKYDLRRPASQDGKYEERYWSILNAPLFDKNHRVICIINHPKDVTEFIKMQQRGEEQTLLNQELQMYKDKISQEIANNIDERNKATEELRLAKINAEKLAEEAMVANKTKSDFLATMSHEIRTPLNGIIGMTDLLMLTQPTQEQREHLETIRFSGEALLTVINDILDFSKIESGHMELDPTQFKIHQLVESMLDTVAISAHVKNVAIGAIIDQDVPEVVMGDVMRIAQIIKNLLSNAIKFTNEGQVSLHISMQAQQLRFEVVDTGIGMNELVQSRLFQPFVQGESSINRKYGGSGLGLVICKRLLDLMGGTISVRSELGKGSSFCFTLNLPSIDAAKNTKQEEFFPTLENMRVLVVDDNEINRTILNKQLSSWGMRCDLLDSGLEVIDIMREAALSGSPYNLAILDCMMPILDGIELSKKIFTISELSGTRIIMLTSVGLPIPIKELNNIGINICLPKPIHQSKLYDTIVAVLKTKHEIIQSPSVTQGLASHAPEPAGDTPRGNILIVDDNSTNQEVSLRMLKYLGYNTMCVQNGVEAIEAFNKNNYDLILMDCQMPIMDGYTATQKIREIEKAKHLVQTPIIALTAHALTGDREKCLQAGMSDYISKPVRIKELETKIEAWLQNKSNAAPDQF